MPDVTVAFVPRETVSLTIANLETLLQCTDLPFDLVCVDPGYPAPIGARLRELAQGVGGTTIGFDGFVTPNQARNAALKDTRTPYIVFVDNDATVEKGWLAPLLRAAVDNQAAIVTPLIFERYPQFRFVHMAGGECRLEKLDNGRNAVVDTHHHAGRDTVNEPVEFVAGPTELAEFHTVLVETAFLRELGGLDSGLHSVHEHWDMCLQARLGNRPIWFEPRSRVTYSPPRHVMKDDLRYFEIRWCDELFEASMARIAEKYFVDRRDGGLSGVRRFHRNHQSHRYAVTRRWLTPLVGNNTARRIVRDVVRPVHKRLRGGALARELADWKRRTERLGAAGVSGAETAGTP